MKPGRLLVLEGGLLAGVVAAPVFFGAVYPWALFSLSTLFFLLLFLYPEALFEVRHLNWICRTGFPVLLGLILIQWLFTSQNRYATGSELLKWLAFSAAFLLVQLLERRALWRLSAAFLLLGVFEACYGLWQVRLEREMVLWQVKEAHGGYLTGTYLNRNHAAGLFELSLGVQLGILLEGLRRRNWKALVGSSFFLVVTLTGFFQTGSRMGLLSFLISFSVLALILVRGTPSLPRLFLFLLPAAGIAFFLGRQALFLRVEDLAGNLSNWDGGRIWVWQHALKILRDFPWLGIGLGSFEWVFPAYQTESLLMGWAHAHNDYLELAVELGVPGFLLLVISVCALWVQGVWGHLKEDISAFPLLWGSYVALFAFLLHGLSDFNFAVPANALLFTILAALTFRWHYFLREEGGAHRGRE